MASYQTLSNTDLENGGSDIESTTREDTSNNDSNSNIPPGTSSSHTLSTRQRITTLFSHFLPIKQTYQRINNGLTTGRMITNNGTFIGHGTDGVFRNLMAKPERDTTDNEVNPPTYLQASEDSVPQYWESSVISPMYEDEVFVQGLPVGNIANFIWNALVSIAFQFVGFVLCYLLHTSHAAKHGSRLGLGITFILQGYQMVPTHFTHATRLPAKIIVDRPNDIVVDKSMEITGSPFTYSAVDSFSPFSDTSLLSETVKTPIFAYSLIAFGIFLIFKSLIDYYRVKQLEKGILAPQFQSDTVNLTTEVLENVQD